MNLNKISKKYVNYLVFWRIIALIIVAACLVPEIIIILNLKNLIATILTLVLVAIIMIMMIIYAFVFPTLTYNKYFYYIDEDKIIINKGIFFKRKITIPLIQIQDVELYQGPIETMFKIARIEVSTAGSDHFIVGLNKETADEIYQNVYELVHKKLVVNANETTK